MNLIFAFISALCLATDLIDKKMSSIQQRLDNKQEVQGEYLTYLLQNPEMSTKDVYGSTTELLLAGVDTVSEFPLGFSHPKSHNCFFWTTVKTLWWLRCPVKSVWNVFIYWKPLNCGSVHVYFWFLTLNLLTFCFSIILNWIENVSQIPIQLHAFELN